MKDWRQEIQDKQNQQKENIFKGIVGGEEMLEKARQVGETKQGNDGITRVWSKTPSGFDWRRVKGDKTSTGGGGTSPKKEDSSDRVTVSEGGEKKSYSRKDAKARGFKDKDIIDSKKGKQKKSTPKKTPNTDINQTYGKVKVSMDKNNLRLRAKIGSNLVYIGGNNNDGYFKDTASAQAFLDTNKDKLTGIKTMNKLIYTEFEDDTGLAHKTGDKGYDDVGSGGSSGGSASGWKSNNKENVDSGNAKGSGWQEGDSGRGEDSDEDSDSKKQTKKEAADLSKVSGYRYDKVDEGDKLDADGGREILDEIIRSPKQKGREILDFVAGRIPMTENQWDRYQNGKSYSMLLDSKDPKDKVKLLKSLRKLLVKPDTKGVLSFSEYSGKLGTETSGKSKGHTTNKKDFQSAIKAGDINVEKTSLHEWMDNIGVNVKMWVQTDKGIYKKGKMNWDKTGDTDSMSIKFEDGTSKTYSGFDKTVWRVKPGRKDKLPRSKQLPPQTPPGTKKRKQLKKPRDTESGGKGSGSTKKPPYQKTKGQIKKKTKKYSKPKSPGMTPAQLKATQKKKDSGDTQGAMNDVLDSWGNL